MRTPFFATLVLTFTPGFAQGQVAVVDDVVPGGVTTEDWSAIRAAYEAGRHKAFAMDGGYEARNPGQQWRTRFDGRGFTTLPDADDWTWGLELERYGFDGSEREVTVPACVSDEGGRVTYDWDATLEEWYVNDLRGLEHGYTVRRRPHLDGQGEEGPLSFTLAVRGTLSPEVTADCRGVSFLDGEAAVALTYTGLSVLDADGRELEASFERVGDRLRLSIDERGARYPLTIDPLAQRAYLKASNPNQYDWFGTSVAVSGDTVVVGAPLESSNATGVNGNQSNNTAKWAGAAYVFVREVSGWSQQAYLKASNTDADDRFGRPVAISGDTLVVGARLERSRATGVNGNEADNGGYSAGAAYVFVRNGQTWSQEAYLKASNTGDNDYFGFSVAVSDNTVVVGAYGEASNASGVNGNQSNNFAQQAGAAYVFERIGGVWSQQAYLKASNTDAGDYFGLSVTVSGETLVVGAPLEASGATGVNGDQSDNSAPSAGAAYVFSRSGSTWSQDAYLKASNAEASDVFGFSTAVIGDTLMIGAEGEDSNAQGVNGNQDDNSAEGAGAAYAFVRNGTTWSQEAYLKASNAEAGDKFGRSVALSDDAAVVGAKWENSGASGVNGDQDDNSAANAGAAYAFLRSGSTWSQAAYLKASNTDAGDNFGSSVSMSGGLLMVGAPFEDSSAQGVNGNQADNSLVDAGAVYAFELSFTSGEVYCTAGTSASGCRALLGASGVPSATAPSGFDVTAAGVEGSKDGLFFFGANGRQASPWGNGTSYQCVVPPARRTPLQSGSGTAGACDGSFSQDLNALWCPSCPKPLHNPGAGASVQAQLWYRDPANTSNRTTSLSDGLEFFVSP